MKVCCPDYGSAKSLSIVAGRKDRYLPPIQMVRQQDPVSEPLTTLTRVGSLNWQLIVLIRNAYSHDTSCRGASTTATV